MMASGDTAAIDTIDVESALSTKNSEYTTSSSNYNKDHLLHEQDEYGKFIKDTPGKQVLSDGVSVLSMLNRSFYLRVDTFLIGHVFNLAQQLL